MWLGYRNSGKPITASPKKTTLNIKLRSTCKKYIELHTTHDWLDKATGTIALKTYSFVRAGVGEGGYIVCFHCCFKTIKAGHI